MLRMLLGRTGSGKTTKVISEIRSLLKEQSRDVYLIVPEQQHYSVERALLSSLSSKEAERLTVTSFTKLCDTLEDLYGGRAHTTLTNASSALLMWLNLRSLSGLLETYGNIPSGAVALTRMMLDTAKELSMGGITAEQLEAAASKQEAHTPLASKLRDVSLIMASYRNLVSELCGQDPSDRLLRACEQIRKHAPFENTVVYLDSFSGFTAPEYQMLSHIMAQASETVITLGIQEYFSSEPQFESLRDTYTRLNKICGTLGITRITEKSECSAASDELECLEKGLWEFTTPPFDVPESGRGQIKLTTAPNPYEEAEAVALHILELHEMGIPYGEIAVVVRDMQSWRGILDAALEQYQIPYFLSEKTDLNTKPAARLLFLALRCISRHFQISDIMSLCKTGLCGVSARDLDFFEEYTDTWHLSGKRMTEDTWSMNPDGYTAAWSKRGRMILEAANRVRETVMTPLLILEVKLKGATSPADQCKALYEYLCDLQVKKQLAEQGETYLRLNRVREAGETVRLWSFINEALSTIVTVSSTTSEGDHPLTADELSGVLSLIYAETDIGSVPARHDCVVVGTADTLRVDNIKASLLLGLNEGEFPRAVSQSGLFTEQEKAVLTELGVEFTSRESTMNSDELLYVYRAMTKPSEKLYLSRSLAGTDGKELSPSAAFTRVTHLLPHLNIIPYTSAYVKGKTVPYLPKTEDKIPKERAYALLGEEMWLSRSKLQRYAHCPYSYYGSYILKLRERVSARVDNLTSGLFLHHVLEVFLKRALGQDGRIIPMNDEEIFAITGEIIEAYIKSINHSPALYRQGRFLHTFERLRAIALVLIKDMIAELGQGSFTPVGFEWDTHGYKPEDPLPMILPLEDVNNIEDSPVGIKKGSSVLLKMGGVIDRVDIYRSEDGKKVYIRVVDYKSSKHELSEKTMTEDMDVQLLLYLFTLCAENNRHLFADENGHLPEVVLPAEAIYLSPQVDGDTGDISPVRSGLVLEDDEILRAVSRDLNTAYFPTGIKQDKNGALSGKALCSQERLHVLQELLNDTIREQARGMYEGDACRTPSSDGCKFCSLRESCPLAEPIKAY
ncbi:MAG: PD-(D/E)XK nuclease family protein [Clostridia bacterium]|nr:PD-(D/E)XK nuclease family protein [Clostridia bacterium]